jgi:hypothetical protein
MNFESYAPGEPLQRQSDVRATALLPRILLAAVRPDGRATRRRREPPSHAEIERGLREKAVTDPRAAAILLRWLQGPARTTHRVWISTACRRHSWSACTRVWCGSHRWTRPFSRHWLSKCWPATSWPRADGGSSRRGLLSRGGTPVKGGVPPRADYPAPLSSEGERVPASAHLRCETLGAPRARGLM